MMLTVEGLPPDMTMATLRSIIQQGCGIAHVLIEETDQRGPRGERSANIGCADGQAADTVMRRFHGVQLGMFTVSVRPFKSQRMDVSFGNVAVPVAYDSNSRDNKSFGGVPPWIQKQCEDPSLFLRRDVYPAEQVPRPDFGRPEETWASKPYYQGHSEEPPKPSAIPSLIASHDFPMRMEPNDNWRQISLFDRQLETTLKDTPFLENNRFVSGPAQEMSVFNRPSQDMTSARPSRPRKVVNRDEERDTDPRYRVSSGGFVRVRPRKSHEENRDNDRRGPRQGCDKQGSSGRYDRSPLANSETPVRFQRRSPAPQYSTRRDDPKMDRREPVSYPVWALGGLGSLSTGNGMNQRHGSDRTPIPPLIQTTNITGPNRKVARPDLARRPADRPQLKRTQSPVHRQQSAKISRKEPSVQITPTQRRFEKPKDSKMPEHKVSPKPAVYIPKPQDPAKNMSAKALGTFQNVQFKIVSDMFGCKPKTKNDIRKEYSATVKNLKTKIGERIFEIFKTVDRENSNAVFAEYRKRYPVSQDKELLKELLLKCKHTTPFAVEKLMLETPWHCPQPLPTDKEPKVKKLKCQQTCLSAAHKIALRAFSPHIKKKQSLEPPEKHIFDYFRIEAYDRILDLLEAKSVPDPEEATCLRMYNERYTAVDNARFVTEAIDNYNSCNPSTHYSGLFTQLTQSVGETPELKTEQQPVKPRDTPSVDRSVSVDIDSLPTVFKEKCTHAGALVALHIIDNKPGQDKVLNVAGCGQKKVLAANSSEKNLYSYLRRVIADRMLLLAPTAIKTVGPGPIIHQYRQRYPKGTDPQTIAEAIEAHNKESPYPYCGKFVQKKLSNHGAGISKAAAALAIHSLDKQAKGWLCLDLEDQKLFPALQVRIEDQMRRVVKELCPEKTLDSREVIKLYRSKYEEGSERQLVRLIIEEHDVKNPTHKYRGQWLEKDDRSELATPKTDTELRTVIRKDYAVLLISSQVLEATHGLFSTPFAPNMLVMTRKAVIERLRECILKRLDAIDVAGMTVTEMAQAYRKVHPVEEDALTMDEVATQVNLKKKKPPAVNVVKSEPEIKDGGAESRDSTGEIGKKSGQTGVSQMTLVRFWMKHAADSMAWDCLYPLEGMWRPVRNDRKVKEILKFNIIDKMNRLLKKRSRLPASPRELVEMYRAVYPKQGDLDMARYLRGQKECDLEKMPFNFIIRDDSKEACDKNKNGTSGQTAAEVIVRGDSVGDKVDDAGENGQTTADIDEIEVNMDDLEDY